MPETQLACEIKLVLWSIHPHSTNNMENLESNAVPGNSETAVQAVSPLFLAVLCMWPIDF